MTDLDTDVFFALDGKKEGEIAQAFQSKGPDGSISFRMILLVSRSKPHQADLKQDYGKIQQAALEQKKASYTEKWVLDKLRSTFLSVGPMLGDCVNLQEMLGIAGETNKP